MDEQMIVTDAMIEAGRHAWDCNMGGNPASVLRAIYTAMAAHSVMAGKVAELEKALRMVHSYVADALDSVPALDAIVALDAISDVVEAALAPHPKGME